MGAAVILLTACAEMTASGDAGCASYGIARATMPSADTLPADPWGAWVADTDDRMTGACR